MAIQVHIHKTHRQFTSGKAEVWTEGDTVGACLKDLIRQFPAMQPSVFDHKGGLKNTLEIYVNHQSAFPKELEKRVKDGDEIHLTLLLAGG